MPTAGAQLRAKLADRGSNPVRNAGNPSIPGAPGLAVTVDLIFQGVDFKPEDLFDALEAKYGANKVQSNHDSFGRLGPLNFRIIP